MLELAQALQEARTVEGRARILKDELSGREGNIGRRNGGLVLEIDEHKGLRVGDGVRYVDALGNPADGYLSHFFSRLQDTSASQLATLCASHLATAEKRPYGNREQPIIPVIVPVSGSGYSTHRGHGLPQKLSV